MESLRGLAGQFRGALVKMGKLKTKILPAPEDQASIDERQRKLDRSMRNDKRDSKHGNNMEITPKNISPSDVMTVDEVAAYLRIKVTAVKHLRRTRRLAFTTYSGKLMCRQRWIDEFLEAGKE